MKRFFLNIAAILALTTLLPCPVQADMPTETSNKASKKKAKSASPVVAAVKKVKKVKGRINPKADYYIYLYSASWCGPCRQEMPEIVELYDEMKKTGKVDIILFCQDKTLPAAKAFVKEFNIKFLTVMGNDDKVTTVPGHAPIGGIPHCIFVDREGRTIRAGHPGNLMSLWKSLTIEREPSDAPETE